MDEIARLLENLRQELLRAKYSFFLWKTLENRDEATARAMNPFRGFFAPSIDALYIRFVIKTMNVVGSDPRLPSARRLLNMIRADPHLSSAVDVVTLGRRFRRHQSTVNKLKVLRDKRVAHWDTESAPETYPTVGQVEALHAELEAIFHEVNAVVNPGHHWFFEYSEDDHLESLLGYLRGE